MPYLPIELENIDEETAVVGDIDAFIDYIENGQALHDWYARLETLAAEYDLFLKEHSHVWNHIIIQTGQHQHQEAA